MMIALWHISWFLVFTLQSSTGLKLEGIFNENVSVVEAVQLLMPTLNSENEKCREHTRFYLEELKNFRLWATEMYDATAKFPSGILYGDTYALGNFDQCMEITVPYRKEEFGGKYCIAKFTVNPPAYVGKNHNVDYERDDFRKYFNISTWEKLAAFSNDVSKGSRNELYFSFCLPSTCTNEDLRTSLYDLINEYNKFIDFEVIVDVDERSCQVKEEVRFTPADITFLCIVAFIAIIVIMASAYDLMTKMEDMEYYRVHSKLHKIIKCFSFRRNLKKLASQSKNEDGLDCIAGLKVLSMFFIILGHRCMFTFGSPLVNPKFIEEMYTKVEATVLLNGPIIVDTFFIISGFLASYLALTLLDKNKRINIFLIYLHRILRMLPVYAIVLAFYCTIFVKLGSGPFWQERVGLEQERCIESWWANVLYVNNYVNVDKLCMFQSWYLTCDMHYFVLIPFLVLLLRKKPTLGLMTVLAILFVSIVTVFTIVYINNADAILLLYMRLLKDPVQNKTFRDIYIPTHMRASPYFLGVLIGYIKYKIKVTNYKMPKHLVHIGWTLCVLIVITTVYTGFIFYLPQFPHVSIFSALYASMHHFTFSLCIGWIIIAVSSGNGPWIEPILSWKPLILLSRITYPAFLSHGAIQIYTAAILRKPKYANYFPTLYDACGDIILAYIAAFILSIYIEAPIIGLEKLIFSKEGKSKKTTQETADNMAVSILKIKTVS